MSGSTTSADEQRRDVTTDSGEANEWSGHDSRIRAAIRRLVLLGAPLALGLVMWIHPHSGDDVYANLSPVVDRFLVTHLLALLLFGLLAIALYLLLDGYRGPVAAIGRIGLGVYALFYLTMVAILGVTTGLLVREGQSLPAEQQEGVAAAVQYLHAEPLIFGAGVLGALGYLVAVVAIATVLHRADAPLVPLVLLVGSVVGIGGHSGFAGILGMALFVVAVSWLEFGWTPAERTGVDRSYPTRKRSDGDANG